MLSLLYFIDVHMMQHHNYTYMTLCVLVNFSTKSASYIFMCMLYQQGTNILAKNDKVKESIVLQQNVISLEGQETESAGFDVQSA